MTLEYNINYSGKVEKLDYFMVTDGEIIKAVISLIDAILMEEEIKESPRKSRWSEEKQAEFVFLRRNALLEEMKKIPVDMEHNIPIRCTFEPNFNDNIIAEYTGETREDTEPINGFYPRKHQLYFELTADAKNIVVGLRDILLCLEEAEKTEKVPHIDMQWWNSVKKRYQIE